MAALHRPFPISRFFCCFYLTIFFAGRVVQLYSLTLSGAYARVRFGGLCRLGGRRPDPSGGRKVRAPLGRVLGNAQASGGSPDSIGTPLGDGKWHRNIPPRPVGVRVKSDGKSVRPSAVTQRRLNPTWSKAE